MFAKRNLHRIHRFGKDQSGASGVEFVLVLPLFLFMVFGVMASGVVMYAAMQLQQATETTARCLSAQRGADLASGGCNTGAVAFDTSIAVTPFAAARYQGPGLNGLTFTAHRRNAQCNGFLVTGSGSLSLFGGFGMSVPLTSSACYPYPSTFPTA